MFEAGGSQLGVDLSENQPGLLQAGFKTVVAAAHLTLQMQHILFEGPNRSAGVGGWEGEGGGWCASIATAIFNLCSQVSLG